MGGVKVKNKVLVTDKIQIIHNSFFFIVNKI